MAAHGPGTVPAADVSGEKRQPAGIEPRAALQIDRPLGSTDKCIRCGKEYTVDSARQKYCPDCAYEAVRAVDRPASRAWNQANKETYYPSRNEKRRKERAENPELVRAKERATRAKRKSKT